MRRDGISEVRFLFSLNTRGQCSWRTVHIRQVSSSFSTITSQVNCILTSSLARYDWAVAIAAHQTQPRSFRLYVKMYRLCLHWTRTQYTAHNSEIYSIPYVSIGLWKDIISDCRLPMVVLDQYVFTFILKIVRCFFCSFFFSSFCVSC